MSNFSRTDFLRIRRSGLWRVGISTVGRGGHLSMPARVFVLSPFRIHGAAQDRPHRFRSCDCHEDVTEDDRQQKNREPTMGEVGASAHPQWKHIGPSHRRAGYWKHNDARTDIDRIELLTRIEFAEFRRRSCPFPPPARVIDGPTRETFAIFSELRPGPGEYCEQHWKGERVTDPQVQIFDGAAISDPTKSGCAVEAESRDREKDEQHGIAPVHCPLYTSETQDSLRSFLRTRSGHH